MPRRSLQQQLIASSMIGSLLAGAIGLLLLLCVSGYFSMQMHDDMMEEIADLLLVQPSAAAQRHAVAELADEFDLYYQYQQRGQQLRSPDAVEIKLQAQTGWHLSWQKGQVWRSYVEQKTSSGMQVWVWQSLNQRLEELALQLLSYTAGLIFIGLLQWAILHGLIARRLRPLLRLSEKIRGKSASDLLPLDPSIASFVELEPIVQQLNQLLQRLESALHAEQRFTADASHELRSPLSAMQMRLQLLQRQYPQPQALQQALQQLQADVERGTHVLENLLLLARLDPTHSQQLPMQSFDLNDLIYEVLNRLAPFLAEKKLIIHQQVQPQLLYANRELYFICLRNLLDNAIRYAKVDGQVWISMQIELDRVIVCIEDDGEQLQYETLARMGQRFYRALGTQTQGSGLGLSICQKILTLHQANWQLQRSQHGGLAVRLFLPLKKQ